MCTECDRVCWETIVIIHPNSTRLYAAALIARVCVCVCNRTWVERAFCSSFFNPAMRASFRRDDWPIIHHQCGRIIYSTAADVFGMGRWWSRIPCNFPRENVYTNGIHVWFKRVWGLAREISLDPYSGMHRWGFPVQKLSVYTSTLYLYYIPIRIYTKQKASWRRLGLKLSNLHNELRPLCAICSFVLYSSHEVHIYRRSERRAGEWLLLIFSPPL